MDKRIVEFIRTLRAAGVRISVAESADAMQAADQMGIADRDWFHGALKATLVKEHSDEATFDHFFPLFFDTGAPPMFDMEQELSPEQQEMLKQALQAMAGNREALQAMLDQMMRGQPLSQEQLDQLGQVSGVPNGDNPRQEGYYQRMMQRALGMQQLQEMLNQLEAQLQEMGMSEEAIQDIMEMLEANREALAEQIAQYVGSSIARQMAEQPPEEKPDLMNTPFEYLGSEEVDQLRAEMKRLAARLRSRAALRQKRAKTGRLDPKATLRHSMRYEGVPLEIIQKDKHVKPRLVLICDISTSMRYCAEFMLTLIYELQDQVSKARSFVFIGDMYEISDFFRAAHPAEAIQTVLTEYPPGHYSTDLGNALNTFWDEKLDALDHKTTVIVLGDGRNNYNDPRLDLAQDMKRRARRMIWFNPEAPREWGSGDSDMDKYAPISDGVYQVRNLTQLVEAIDRIMADG